MNTLTTYAPELDTFRTLEDGPLHIDTSRQPYTASLLDETAYVLEKSRIALFFDAMFKGRVVNPSENRAAGHWTLRAAGNLDLYPSTVRLTHNQRDEITHAQKVQGQMERFVEQVRQGKFRTPEGTEYDSILHLGIGGSDLGPRLLNEVFSKLGLAKCDGGNGKVGSTSIQNIRFVSNVDYHEMKLALEALNPKTTLVVVASKSFSTRETLNNFAHIRNWLSGAGEEYVKHSIVAATCKPEKAIALGIADNQIFEFSETVGGRYSLWGPVSIAIRIVYGNHAFNEFLRGAADMDSHVLNSDFDHSIPSQLAFTDWLNLRNGVTSLMMSPYDSRLSLLVPYLQQLWMESLGKGITSEGAPLLHAACPVLWGDVGTNGQHAFFQMLHQAPFQTSIEILAIARPDHSEQSSHDLLISHAFAQAEAFAVGKFNRPSEFLDSSLNFRTCPGHKPLSLMMLDALTPHALGYLLAMWEHRTVALSAIQSINPFDQWGVELGKLIAEKIEKKIRTYDDQVKETNEDPVTRHLLNLYKDLQSNA